MNRKSRFLKIAVPVIIIIIGIIIMKALISRRSTPEKIVRNHPGILVEVFQAEKENTQVIVKGTGTVDAAREVSLIPQVSGQIVYTDPDLKAGGFFNKDDLLFAIEDTDYRLALERAVSVRTKAELELATIESQAQIARTEWEHMNRDNESPPNPLVLYEPQLKNARSALASAAAQVEQAKLDLDRTKIKAPFNARIRSENVETGQYVKSGSSVADLAGTDTAEIAVPLNLADLQWLDIPRQEERQDGAEASVWLHIGGRTFRWDGHVVRTTGEVDTKSRMMQLIVEVKDPYGLEKEKAPSFPVLAEGSFVDVHIKGRILKGVFSIPRTAFRDNSTVWIMDKENMLQIRHVVPLRIEKEKVIIAEGLADGELIVKTNISGAANGMKLRQMK